ncbi:MAG: PQQ-binding-like beta-propeller repeat protein [Chloroflexota bacterium]|nr:PQQ-binding-like beta-propeller repeat protein [Chloroflexota bacterium]
MSSSRVSGRVYEATSNRGIGRVSVSNGDAIVQTDRDGHYSLSIDPQQDRYVFTTVPAGYRPQESFYALLDGESRSEPIDFPLVVAPERSQDCFKLLHLSDTHVVLDDSGAVSQTVLAQDLSDYVGELAPDLAIVTGDLTNMGTVPELESYRAAIDSVPIPVYSVFGGHDGNIERRSSDGDTPCTLNFEATLGPPYYSFDWGGYHFVVYATEDNYFTAAGRARKERWLWADLALQPSHRKSVLMHHTSPERALLERFQQQNGALILHGHWHSSRVFTLGETTVASAASACFGGIDTRPRGCRAVSFSPQGIQTELHAGSTTTKHSSGPHEHASNQPDGSVPEGIAIGNDTFSLAWQHALNSPLHRAAPVGFNGSVLVSLQSEELPSRNGVTSLDAHSGEEQWHYPTESSIKNRVDVVSSRHNSDDCGGNDWCVALTVTGELHLIAMATGKREWKVDLQSHPLRWVYSAPAHNGEYVIGGSKAGYGAYALATGEQKWHFAPADGDEWPSYICPQVYNEELCIVPVQRRGFLALSMEDGRVVWEQDLPVEYFCASPVLCGDVVVVSSASPHTGASLTGGLQGDLVVLEARTGKVVAHYAQALPGYATGIAVANDRIYAATAAGTVHCFDVNSGGPIWQFQSGEDLLDMTPYKRGIRSLLAAPVPFNGHVLVGGCDGWLSVLDSNTGTCTDRAYFGAPITASPGLTQDGFCVGTYGGSLSAYRIER